MKSLTALAFLCLLSAPAFAKLPLPTPEQMAAAAATKAKAAETAKKDAELLAKYQDLAVANYKQGKQGLAPAMPPATPTKR